MNFSLGKPLCLSLILGALLSGGTAVMAQPRPAASGPAQTAKPRIIMKSGMIWDYKKELGLTGDQISRIQEAIHNFEDKTIELRAKLQIAELDIQALVNQKADLSLIKDKLTQSAGLQVDLRLNDIETARKIDDILTPEQAAKWKAIQQKQASVPPAPARRVSPLNP